MVVWIWHLFKQLPNGNSVVFATGWSDHVGDHGEPTRNRCVERDSTPETHSFGGALRLKKSRRKSHEQGFGLGSA